MNTAQICENALCGKNISREEIVYLLKTAGSEYETLREYARKVRKEYVGNVVHLPHSSYLWQSGTAETVREVIKYFGER